MNVNLLKGPGGLIFFVGKTSTSFTSASVITSKFLHGFSFLYYHFWMTNTPANGDLVIICRAQTLGGRKGLCLLWLMAYARYLGKLSIESCTFRLWRKDMTCFCSEQLQLHKTLLQSRTFILHLSLSNRRKLGNPLHLIAFPFCLMRILHGEAKPVTAHTTLDKISNQFRHHEVFHINKWSIHIRNRDLCSCNPHHRRQRIFQFLFFMYRRKAWY